MEIVSSERRAWRDLFDLTSAEKVLLGFAIGAEVAAFLLAEALDRIVDWAPFLSG